MCCGIFGQGVQRALSLDLNPYGGDKPHLVVVRLILRRGQTNVEIEIREFEGGVRATGLLCLLGVGVGLCTFLAYKIYSQLHLRYFASSSVDKTSFQLSCVSSKTSQTFEAGISLGIKRIRQPGILHRSQLFQSSQNPHVWKMRILDWLSKSHFSPDGEDFDDDYEDFNEFVVEECQGASKPKKGKQLDPMVGSMQSGWSSGFVSNPDNIELSCQSLLPEDSRDWQNYANKEEQTDGMEGEDEEEGLRVSELQRKDCNGNPDSVGLQQLRGDYKCRRPKSGLSSSSTSSNIQNSYLQGIRRNCYSFASQKSGGSSLYDYRESLISKGFSVDLGENLDAVMLPDTDDFASCDHLSTGKQDQGAVNHMDWLQYELMKIQLDIDCLNQKFDDLCQPKSEESVKDHEQHQILEDFVTDKAKNARPHEESYEQTEDGEVRGTPEIETFDFIWDYHSDLASIEQPSFVSARPGVVPMDDVFESHVSNEHGEFGVSHDFFNEESEKDEEDTNGDHSDDPRNGKFPGNGVLGRRRESVVLFYFDDDINDNVIGDFGTSTKNHTSYNNLILSGSNRISRKTSASKKHKRFTNVLTTPDGSMANRFLRPVFPRNLRKTRTEQDNDDNTACCIEKIFSSEERKVIGDEKKLFEHLECDLNVDVVQISNIRKGYSKIFEMWGSSNVRSFRSERYSILGPITFQVLLQGIPILSDIGGNFQNSVQHLVAAIDNGHQYLMNWRYKGFLWAPKNEVLFKLINSLRIFCEQVSATKAMLKKKCREQYLASLLNHSTDMEVHLVEALKVVLMLKVIAFSKITQHQKHVNLEKLYGLKYSSAEFIFKNFVNVIEDLTILDDIQLSLLSITLGINLEIINPSNCGSEGFIKLYPTVAMQDSSSRWDKMSIIEDDPAFLFCMPALPSDE